MKGIVNGEPSRTYGCRPLAETEKCHELLTGGMLFVIAFKTVTELIAQSQRSVGTFVA
jgi:hypothetical protein